MTSRSEVRRLASQAPEFLVSELRTRGFVVLDPSEIPNLDNALIFMRIKFGWPMSNKRARQIHDFLQFIEDERQGVKRPKETP